MLSFLWSVAAVVISGVPAARCLPSGSGVEAGLIRRDWQPNQVNQSVCWWEQPRSAIVRDTLYLDGGYMAYVPGFANGTVGAPVQPENGQFLYAINFTQPFKTSQNASEVLRTINKTAGAANNLAPNYYDGAMFSNDNEFYLYGGVIRDTDSLRPPAADSVLGYERYQFGPPRETWQPGFYDGQLPDGVTRYVTAGAGVSIPSENLGFYFSGMRARGWGDVRARGRSQYNATVVADTLISIDMSTMRDEVWKNVTIPTGIPGRANAELVWVPVAERGLLVAIGGVIEPEWAFRSLSDEAKQNTSPGFMKSVPVYDIKSQKWYEQDTSGDTPPQLTQFCSVVASSKDASSHNIYIYGGYDGIEDANAPSDDVYVLSVPSFIWTKVYSGTAGHGRRSHKCAKVYPDQMLVVGGQSQQLDTYNCLAGGVIQVFNLNTLKWQDNYDPAVWSEYKVPDVVIAKIGGKPDGGAKSLAPSKWSDNTLSDLFGAKYTKPLPTYHPYASITVSPNDPANPTRLPTTVPTPLAKSGGVPKWVAPVLGVVLGLIALTAAAVCFILFRRRKYLKQHGATSDAGMSTGNRIMNWIPFPPPKAATVTTSEDTSDSSGVTAVGEPGSEKQIQAVYPVANGSAHEAASSPVHEMWAEMPAPTELPTSAMGSVGFVPAQHRPIPPITTSNSDGAGIPRPESPTTSEGHNRHASDDESLRAISPPVTAWTRMHARNVSSIGSAGLPSPDSGMSEEGRAATDSRDSPDPREMLRGPVSPEPDRIGAPRPQETSAETQSDAPRVNQRQSSFGEDFR
ncbi:MAG: hypothetical protein M1832_002132 [Thelocarpon impressellum]|nr:MAG: hypothetical protein M1832_002132 [Thelocarpon impressellum]